MDGREGGEKRGVTRLAEEVRERCKLGSGRGVEGKKEEEEV